NAVCPGPIETDMTRTGAPTNVDYDTYHAALMQYPYLKRIGTAEEVADAILYLASDAAAFVTGAMLSIDGGSTVARGGRKTCDSAKQPHASKNSSYISMI